MKGRFVAEMAIMLILVMPIVIKASNGQTMIKPVSGTVTQEFSGSHPGIDVAAPQGTSVYATSDGIVQDVRTGSFPGDTGAYGAGNYVVIKHKPGDSNRYRYYCPSEDWTVYCHLNTVNTVIGANVRQGQLIGGVGKTGNATGFHLHFEIRENARHGTQRNPREYIRFGDGKDIW